MGVFRENHPLGLLIIQGAKSIFQDKLSNTLDVLIGILSVLRSSAQVGQGIL